VVVSPRAGAIVASNRSANAVTRVLLGRRYSLRTIRANADAKEPSTMRPADAVPDHRRPRRRLRAPAVVAVALSLLVAGCGGGGKSPGVANVSTTTTSTAHSSSPANNRSASGGPTLSGGSPSTSPGAGRSSQFAMAVGNPQKALKFSECMRANGEPSFPDPNGQGVIQGSGIDPSSAAFQKAQKACVKYMGGGRPPSPVQQAKAQADALAFSQCMRSHGVPDFPDPKFSSGGGISISLNGRGGSGLDPDSPIFQKAQKTCQPLMGSGLPDTRSAS
jgi:hypothetical protein